ncbi:hypothetical protein KY285_036964 [Solanum tuberosum]|nr:hypothetical protein KY285_036964 [Solanum tuberosum]
MQRKNQQLKNEDAEVEAKLNTYLQKFKQLENIVLLEEKEAAKKCAVDVSLIQKMLQHFQANDNDVVQVNTKASAANAHLRQKQLSPPAPPSVHSTPNANANANASDSLQLEDKNTTNAQQAAETAATSSLSTAYSDCFNCQHKLYIQATQPTIFTDIAHMITVKIVISPIGTIHSSRELFDNATTTKL